MASNIFFKTLMLKGEAGGTITSIEKIGVSGGAYVFRIHLSDGSHEDFEVDEVIDNEVVNSLIAAAMPNILAQAAAAAATQIDTALLTKVYPVGSIFVSVSNTNPATYLGGTWVSFGSGKTLIGVDTSDSDFDSVEETGGAKTHTLTVNEMPAHDHEHDHNVAYSSSMPLADSRIYSDHVDDPAGTDHYVLTAAQGAGTPGMLDIQKTSAVGSNLKTWPDSTSTGGGAAHSILNPYITVYFWKRTA